jgi:hypothetical protein
LWTILKNFTRGAVSENPRTPPKRSGEVFPTNVEKRKEDPSGEAIQRELRMPQKFPEPLRD